MKQLFCLLTLLCFLFSCKKDEIKNEPSSKEWLAGTLMCTKKIDANFPTPQFEVGATFFIDPISGSRLILDSLLYDNALVYQNSGLYNKTNVAPFKTWNCYNDTVIGNFTISNSDSFPSIGSLTILPDTVYRSSDLNVNTSLLLDYKLGFLVVVDSVSSLVKSKTFYHPDSSVMLDPVSLNSIPSSNGNYLHLFLILERTVEIGGKKVNLRTQTRLYKKVVLV